MSIDYLICAAGEGTRLRALVDLPKPAIRLHGKSLLEWSLESLELYPGDRLIFIVQAAHGLRARLGPDLAEIYAGIDLHWVELPGLTSGQLATALTARHLLRAHHPLVIFNSDTYFRSRVTAQSLGAAGVDGFIPCSREEGSEWSFCAVGTNGLVTKVTEKVRISDLASVGYYYFGSRELFLQFADAEIAAPAGPETYVAPLYNRLIAAGGKIQAPVVDRFLPMGTLKQLETYWKVTAAELRAQNRAGVLVVDLDGTLTVDDLTVSYADRQPNLALIARLKEWHARGYQIIVHTARRMRTHGSNEAKVIADIGQITLDWLRRFEVPFDGLKFGKPNSDEGFYIDDRALRPNEFIHLSPEEIAALLKKGTEQP